jgi:hypothetical protein
MNICSYVNHLVCTRGVFNDDICDIDFFLFLTLFENYF